jgi:large subunit ribosomal protein L5
MTQEPELLTEYKTRILGAMREKHGYKNIHQIPKISKVVINTCIGSAQDTKEALEIAKSELTTISGQRPVTTISKKAISNFKLREEQAIGAKVTLRGRIMYEFLERLIKTALPRIRDFRGVSTRAFDGNGNYTLGVTDQIRCHDRYHRPHQCRGQIPPDRDGNALCGQSQEGPSQSHGTRRLITLL